MPRPRRKDAGGEIYRNAKPADPPPARVPRHLVQFVLPRGRARALEVQHEGLDGRAGRDRDLAVGLRARLLPGLARGLEDVHLAVRRREHGAVARGAGRDGLLDVDDLWDRCRCRGRWWGRGLHDEVLGRQGGRGIVVGWLDEARGGGICHWVHGRRNMSYGVDLRWEGLRVCRRVEILDGRALDIWWESRRWSAGVIAVLRIPSGHLGLLFEAGGVEWVFGRSAMVCSYFGTMRPGYTLGA
jgi:hypothetical protein